MKIIRKQSMGDFVVTVLVGSVALALVGCATIWCLNTLFSLDIDYTFQTVLAALLLMVAIGSSKGNR